MYTVDHAASNIQEKRKKVHVVVLVTNLLAVVGPYNQPPLDLLLSSRLFRSFLQRQNLRYELA